MIYTIPSNLDVARMLDEIAQLLEIQHANPHKVRAYRKGASYIRKLDTPVAELVQAGDGNALQALPSIGTSLARLIEEFIQTGKSRLLSRLQGEVSPEDLFEQVPGIGPELADRIVQQLDIKTLEELEQAAHDGRLAKVEGFGRRRLEAVQVSLAGMLSGFARRRVSHLIQDTRSLAEWQPPVELILAVDREYRKAAAAGRLRKIAPRRFNPGNVAWLPIYHTEKGDWTFTALFSNTARAHELNKTNDWVVIYFEENGQEGQATVVTETSGLLSGKRVVRGREKACHAYYAANN
ncbi:MAG: DNA-binding protein [Bacteroidetes bacterium]|nr:MAG: DNA-binding protein [Bacteroidota bacterium]